MVRCKKMKNINCDNRPEKSSFNYNNSCIIANMNKLVVASGKITKPVGQSGSYIGQVKNVQWAHTCQHILFLAQVVHLASYSRTHTQTQYYLYFEKYCFLNHSTTPRIQNTLNPFFSPTGTKFNLCLYDEYEHVSLLIGCYEGSICLFLQKFKHYYYCLFVILICSVSSSMFFRFFLK